MKVIQKEEIIPPRPEKKITKTVYMASDGKEFWSEFDCKRYEKQLEVQKHPVFRSRITGIWDFYDEHMGSAYFISSEEDYEFWKENIGTRYLNADHWKDGFGPGWYIFWSVDGGDGPDSHYLHKFTEYVKEIRVRIELWYDDVIDKINEKGGPWE